MPQMANMLTLSDLCCCCEERISAQLTLITFESAGCVVVIFIV